MAKRIAYLLVSVLLVAGAGVMGYRMLRGRALQLTTSGEQPRVAGPARVLLNEILFQPLSGQPPWVELINTGQEAVSAAGVVLLNQDGASYSLPASVNLPAGGVVVVQFDGSARIEGTTVHAEPTTFLHPETGWLTLTVRGQPEDEAFWSTTGGLSLNLGRGGRIPRFKPGTTIGRPPAATARSPDAWTVFPSAETTPGALNPYPSVTGLMPLSGAVLRSTSAALSWYSVPTAIRYRVLVATDRSFAAPVFDRTIDAAPAKEPTTLRQQVDLPRPGRYYWRVQPMFENGQTAAVSRTAVFWTQPNAAAASIFDELSFVRTAHAAAPVEDRPVTLPVPLILQGKDTRLLALEAETEVGARPWDAPWQNPPVGPFCGRASIAMVTAFYRGRLSQDRITYEAFKDFRPGPIFDLYPKKGFGDQNIFNAMTYALSGEPTLAFTETLTAKEYFELHKARIDDKVPVVASTDVHVFVVVGYGEDERGKYLTINDPAIGQYDWLLVPRSGMEEVDRQGPFFDETISTSFFPPPNARGKSDEPEIALDSDGDGVMDFDEWKRFGTSRYSADSDQDGIGDKQEIRAWVYDVGYGWARTNPNGRPFDVDQDDKRMEMDEDSDNGGCFDGMEDLNANGKYEPDRKELYNFLKDDDPCIRGDYKALWHYVQPPSGGQGRKEMEHRHTATFALMPTSDGTLKGRGHVFFNEEIVSFMPTPDCKYTMSVGPVSWTVDLTGQATRLPDGTMEVTMRATPEKGPPIPVRATNACPPFSLTQTSPAQSWDWGGPYKLVNGLYKHTLGMSPIPPGATGTQSSEITVQMKLAQGR